MLTSSQYCTTEGHPSVSPNDDSGVAMPTTPPREQHQEQPRRRPSQRQRYSQEAMRQILEMSPRGYYLAHEVGWLAGVSGDRIGQWARRGYIRSSVSSVVPGVYSFQDVAEPWSSTSCSCEASPCGRSSERSTCFWSSNGAWPLTQAPIVTAATGGKDGEPSAALLLERPEGFTDLHPDPLQGVLEIGELRRIASDLRRGGWAVRRLPDLRHVEVDPDRLSGRPTIRGTRVPAELVASLASTGAGRKTLKSDYGVTDRHIRDAKRWWDVVEDMSKAA